jgi:hypothetical protein
MSAPIVVFLMCRLRLLFILRLFGLPAMVRVLRFQSDRIGRQDWLRRDQPHRTQRRDDPSRHVGWHEQSPPTFSPLQASVPRCATQEGRQLHGLAVAYTDERVTSFWRCPEIPGADGGEDGLRLPPTGRGVNVVALSVPAALGGAHRGRNCARSKVSKSYRPSPVSRFELVRVIFIVPLDASEWPGRSAG